MIPLFALALSAGMPLHAQTGASSGQVIEGGMLLPAAAPMTSTKPVASPDLRTVLQMHKPRPPQTATVTSATNGMSATSTSTSALPPVPERQLSAQERTELREQLRHQVRRPPDALRDPARDNLRDPARDNLRDVSSR